MTRCSPSEPPVQRQIKPTRPTSRPHRYPHWLVPVKGSGQGRVPGPGPPSSVDPNSSVQGRHVGALWSRGWRPAWQDTALGEFRSLFPSFTPCVTLASPGASLHWGQFLGQTVLDGVAGPFQPSRPGQCLHVATTSRGSDLSVSHNRRSGRPHVPCGRAQLIKGSETGATHG